MDTNMIIFWTILFTLGVLTIFFLALFIPIVNALSIMGKFSDKVLEGRNAAYLVGVWYLHHKNFLFFMRDEVKERFLQSWVYMTERDYLEKVNKVTSFQTIVDWYEYISEKKEQVGNDVRTEIFWTLYFQYSLIDEEIFEGLISRWKEQEKKCMNEAKTSIEVVKRFEASYLKINTIRNVFNEYPIKKEILKITAQGLVMRAFIECFNEAESKIFTSIEDVKLVAEEYPMRNLAIVKMIGDETLPLEMRAKIEKAFKSTEPIAKVA